MQPRRPAVRAVRALVPIRNSVTLAHVQHAIRQAPLSLTERPITPERLVAGAVLALQRRLLLRRARRPLSPSTPLEDSRASARHHQRIVRTPSGGTSVVYGLNRTCQFAARHACT